MRLAQTSLGRNVSVCGSMRAKRGIPRDLEGEGKPLKKETSALRRFGYVMVQMRKAKTCVNDKYNPWRNNWKWRKDRKTNVEIKKPYAVGQYNKFIKGIDMVLHACTPRPRRDILGHSCFAWLTVTFNFCIKPLLVPYSALWTSPRVTRQFGRWPQPLMHWTGYKHIWPLC